MKNQILKTESGAVLVIMVIFTIMILVLAAMSVDTGKMAVSKSQQRHFAGQVALEALKTFSTSAEPSAQERLLAARVRAQEIANFNILLGYVIQGETGGQTISSSPNILGPNDSRNETSYGKITPGIWHFREPKNTEGGCASNGNPTCPCPNGVWQGACFESVDVNNVTLINSVNAMHAELWLKEQNPIKSFFGILSNNVQNIESSATATTSPVHTVFLVDLSRGAHMETHNPYERVGFLQDGSNSSSNPTNYGTPSESAFKLASYPCTNNDLLSNRCLSKAGGIPETCTPIPSDSQNVKPSNCTIKGGIFPNVSPSLYDSIFDYTVALPAGSRNALLHDCPPSSRGVGGAGACDTALFSFRGATANNLCKWKTRHYKYDYQCFDLSYKEGENPVNESYIVDSYQGNVIWPSPDTTAAYNGPEPLTSVLDGIHYALDIYNNRKVNGDQLALIGFDRRTDIDIRRLPNYTPGGATPIPSLIDRKNPLFQTITNLTDITKNNTDVIETSTGRKKAAFMFFPRVDALSDLPGAFETAFKFLIAAPNSDSAQNNVIVFSDGLSNCVNNVPTSGDGNETCGTSKFDFSNMEPSIDQAIEVIKEAYVPNKIKLNFFLYGDITQPHSVVRKSPTNPNQCITDEEYKRDTSLSMVNLDNPEGDSRTASDVLKDAVRKENAINSYFYPNKLANAVQMSKGVWAPLRPACNFSDYGITPDTGRAIEDGWLQEQLDQACADLPSNGVLTNYPNNSPPAGRPPIVDAKGRLTCDPLGKNIQEQIQLQMDKIFKDPYILVE